MNDLVVKVEYGMNAGKAFRDHRVKCGFNTLLH